MVAITIAIMAALAAALLVIGSVVVRTAIEYDGAAYAFVYAVFILTAVALLVIAAVQLL